MPMLVEIPIHTSLTIASVACPATVEHIADRSSGKTGADEGLKLRKLPDLAQSRACLCGVLTAARSKLCLKRQTHRPIGAPNVEIQSGKGELIDGPRSNQSVCISLA